MKYDFERWWPQKPAREKTEPYIRFGQGKALFLNMSFCEALEEQKTTHFEILVDKDKRVMGLKPCGDGAGGYHIKTVPAQFGMSSFVNKYGPALCKRLPVKWSEEHGMWLADLDGREVPDS